MMMVMMKIMMMRVVGKPTFRHLLVGSGCEKERCCESPGILHLATLCLYLHLAYIRYVHLAYIGLQIHLSCIRNIPLAYIR